MGLSLFLKNVHFKDQKKKKKKIHLSCCILAFVICHCSATFVHQRGHGYWHNADPLSLDYNLQPQKIHVDRCTLSQTYKKIISPDKRDKELLCFEHIFILFFFLFESATFSAVCSQTQTSPTKNKCSLSLHILHHHIFIFQGHPPLLTCCCQIEKHSD